MYSLVSEKRAIRIFCVQIALALSTGLAFCAENGMQMTITVKMTDREESQPTVQMVPAVVVLGLGNPILLRAEDVKSAEKEGEGGSKQSAKRLTQISRMYVAIDKFDNKAGVEANQFGTIRARIQEAVVGTRKFEVVEREQLKNALSEQNLLAVGMTDGNNLSAPQSGKMKAAGYVIYGNIMFYGVDNSQVAVGGAASARIRTKLELQVKITDAETGKIMAQKSIVGIGSESRIATSVASVSGNVMEQCERAAVADAAHRVVDALRDICYPARIVKIGKKEALINMTDVEVSLEDRFDVIEAGEEMFDPDTGASLGCDGEVVGRIQVSRPGSKTSGAKAISYWDVDEHEMVESKLKDLDQKSSYIVRRISSDRLDAELKDQQIAKKLEDGNRF